MSNIKTILFNTSRMIFENAAFVLVDEPQQDDSAPCFDTTSICSRVNFSGQATGMIAMRVSDKTARAAAGNMLALDDDECRDTGKCKDAVGEILNMICGNFLPAVFGDKAEFHIGQPHTNIVHELHNSEKTATDSRVCSVRLQVEGGGAEVMVLMDGEYLNMAGRHD